MEQKEAETYPKKVLLSLKKSLLDDLDRCALIERRTRSELLRECVRDYLFNFTLRQKQLDRPTAEGI